MQSIKAFLKILTVETKEILKTKKGGLIFVEKFLISCLSDNILKK